MQHEARDRDRRPRQLLALDVLIARRDRGVHGISSEPQLRRDGCGNHGSPVVHANDPRDGVLRREHADRVRCSVRLLEIESEETCGIRRFERTRLLGRHRQLDTNLPRGLHERRRAVGRRGQQQQQARSYFLAAWK